MIAPGLNFRARRASHPWLVRIVPGVLLALAVGAAAHLAARVLFPHALAIGFEVPMAMLGGLLLTSWIGIPDAAGPGIGFAIKRILGLGIMLLGLRLNLGVVADIGSQALLLVVGAMCVTCAFAVIVGRKLGVPARAALLVGIGTSVCGNSAIIAAAPVMRADLREVTFAAATITVFGTVVVFIFPLIGHALGLDVLTFGLWAGAATPDTAQTIAASAAYDTVGRDVATIVKLVRTVCLAPLIVFVAIYWSKQRKARPWVVRRTARRAIPWFLFGFIVLALARTLRLVDPDVVASIDPVTRWCFIVALAALGLQTRLSNLRLLGPRPFALGFGTATLQAAGTLAAIQLLGLEPARTPVERSTDPRPIGAWTAVCEPGARPALAGAFLPVARRVDVGVASACARVDDGDLVQRTTAGTLRLHDGRVAFSGPRRAAAPLPPVGGAAPERVRLQARVVATGIPGAGAIGRVGEFHAGGPIHDKRDFTKATRSGAVLDPDRLLVASPSNFGAPRARPDWAPGTVLSVTTGASRPVRVPAGFAAAGGQAETQDGAVRVYTAQSPAFVNPPNTATAGMPAVTRPLGISVNNAFGRPWIASAGGDVGVESVLDPDGAPLADPPSKRAAGVFAGSLTDRRPQRQDGDLTAPAGGNALLGASPDARNRAVFAVVTADGALAQVHVEDGVDGLAPPGTIAPTRGRVGMVFNWVPDRFLYVTDPRNDAVVQLRLDDDYHVFEVEAVRRLESSQFSEPIDLAPAVPEIANPAFSSNTTLAGGADIYVANRGTGTIARLTQSGHVRAVATVVLPGSGAIGPGRLNGIASDNGRIWLTVDDKVVEVDGFG